MQLTQEEQLERDRDVESKMAKLRPTKAQSDMAFWSSRIVRRGIRIAIGATLGAFGAALMGGSGVLLGKPFSSLSALELIVGLLFGLAGLSCVLGALAIAFFPGKSREEWDKEREAELRARVIGGIDFRS